jgi:eukaryotic-like serine/threonine-protein kinase
MKPGEQSPKKLLGDLSTVGYVPSSDPAVGQLLFVRGATVSNAPGTLMAQPFDTRRLELTGEAVPIAEQVSNDSFSASATDVLIYVAGRTTQPENTQGGVQGQLTWFDREGKVVRAFGDPGLYRTVALSPDGKRVAFDRADPQSPTIRNIWLYDFARGVTTRFTFDSGWDSDPVWSPDGSRIAFGSLRGSGQPFDLYQKTSNLTGEDELLFKSTGESKLPSSWSADARFLLYFKPTFPNHVWLLPLDGAGSDHRPIPFSNSQFNEAAARFSPDGRWIAYSSNESGRDEIYVRPFDASAAMGTSPAVPVTGKWMVSKDGGRNPRWSHDGRELFYLSSVGGMMMAVPVSTTGVFHAGVPKALFEVPSEVLFYDVSSDGKRFLMAAPSAESTAAQPPFTVILNWPSLLKK